MATLISNPDAATVFDADGIPDVEPDPVPDPDTDPDVDPDAPATGLGVGGTMTFMFGGSYIEGDTPLQSVELPDDLLDGEQFWVMVQDGGFTKAIQVEIHDLEGEDFSLRVTEAKYDDYEVFDTLNGDFEAVQDHFDSTGNPQLIATHPDAGGYGLHSVTIAGVSNGDAYIQPDAATVFDADGDGGPAEPDTGSDPTDETSNTLSFISHPDDDLYFMNPDIRASIEDGLGHTTLISTAGDAGGGLSYGLAREEGIKAAYSVMTDSAAWIDETVLFNNGEKTFEVQSSYLEDQPDIRLYFLRLPDGNLGSGYGSTGFESIERLWEGEISVINSIDGENSYTASELSWLMTEVLNVHQPQMLLVQDYDSDTVASDHSDHSHTAHFAMQAQESYDSPHVVRSYVEYASSSLPANLDAETIQENIAVLEAYAQYDGIDPYSDWASRQYSEELINTLNGGEGDGTPPPENAVNLISNGEFAAGDLSGWETGNPSGHSGPDGANGHVSFNAQDEEIYGDYIQQSFATETGSTNTVSMDLSENGEGVSGHSYRVDVLDAAGEPIESRAYSVGDNSTEHVNFEFTASGDTATLRITNISAQDSDTSDATVDNIWVYSHSPEGPEGSAGDQGVTILGTEDTDSLNPDGAVPETDALTSETSGEALMASLFSPLENENEPPLEDGLEEADLLGL